RRRRGEPDRWAEGLESTRDFAGDGDQVARQRKRDDRNRDPERRDVQDARCAEREGNELQRSRAQRDGDQYACRVVWQRWRSKQNQQPPSERRTQPEECTRKGRRKQNGWARRHQSRHRHLSPVTRWGGRVLAAQQKGPSERVVVALGSVILLRDSQGLRFRSTRAGTPATNVFDGTSRVTTKPAATTAPGPTTTPAKTTTPAARQASSQISIAPNLLVPERINSGPTS